MKNMGETAKYIGRNAKALYYNAYNALKAGYDLALDPVKFEELRQMSHGEKGRETDMMLKDYRRQRQTAEQKEDTTPTKYNSLLGVVAIMTGASGGLPAPIVIGGGALLFYLAYDVGHNDNSYLGLGKLVVAPLL